MADYYWTVIPVPRSLDEAFELAGEIQAVSKRGHQPYTRQTVALIKGSPPPTPMEKPRSDFPDDLTYDIDMKPPFDPSDYTVSELREKAQGHTATELGALVIAEAEGKDRKSGIRAIGDAL